MTVGNRHTVAVLKLMRLMPLIEQTGCYLQIQQPIVIPPDSEPEPDASIVIGRVEDRGGRKPMAEFVSCVIEVSDSSLLKDRDTKLELFALGGIGQYVIVNLIDDIVEKYSEPDQAAGTYAKREVRHAEDEFILNLNGYPITIAVRSILPE